MNTNQSINLNISFLGNGGISKAIQALINQENHQISSIIEKGDPWDFEDCDIILVCITPDNFIEHFEELCTYKKDIIIVTTGWYDRIEAVKKIASDTSIKVLWSSNFSIGVNLYFKMIKEAAKLINQFENYDIWATELHHRKKVDSPSGTAKTLGNILLNNIDRKTRITEDTLHRAIEEDEIHFSSTRGGVVNFSHTIGFDSIEDCIEIKHTARNRNGYALGVLKAAEWLSIQKPGFYSMEDFIATQYLR